MAHTDLVAHLAKKSGLVRVSYDGRARAVWHEWVDDAVCLVSGGTEQTLPGIADQHGVTLLPRSRTAALKTGRLADADTAIQRWATESVVVRPVPIGTPDVPAAIDPLLTATRPLLTITPPQVANAPTRAHT
jgi:hypothetical protein